MLVDFYYLTASPLERILLRICEKLLADGDRLLLVADTALLDGLDLQLWSHTRDAFLPHGRSDVPASERQPILLSSDVEPLNGATNIALADGRWRDEALSFARTFYFFDDSRLDDARNAWRALKRTSEIKCRYWKQVDERWLQGS